MQRFLGMYREYGGGVAGMQRGKGCCGHRGGEFNSGAIISLRVTFVA
jgi:hypothetical protein